MKDQESLTPAMVLGDVLHYYLHFFTEAIVWWSQQSWWGKQPDSAVALLPAPVASPSQPFWTGGEGPGARLQHHKRKWEAPTPTTGGCQEHGAASPALPDPWGASFSQALKASTASWGVWLVSCSVSVLTINKRRGVCVCVCVCVCVYAYNIY